MSERWKTCPEEAGGKDGWCWRAPELGTAALELQNLIAAAYLASICAWSGWAPRQYKWSEVCVVRGAVARVAFHAMCCSVYSLLPSAPGMHSSLLHHG